jgi:hypothetical protein
VVLVVEHCSSGITPLDGETLNAGH